MSAVAKPLMDVVEEDGWRRVVVRGVDTYELSGKPGTCACCGELFPTHDDEVLLDCAIACEGCAGAEQASGGAS